MGLLTACRPSSPLRTACDLRRIHRALGLTALGLTVLAVVTGITEHLPEGQRYICVSAVRCSVVCVDLQ